MQLFDLGCDERVLKDIVEDNKIKRDVIKRPRKIAVWLLKGIPYEKRKWEATEKITCGEQHKALRLVMF